MYDVRFTGAKLQKNGQSAKRKPKFFFLFPKPRAHRSIPEGHSKRGSIASPPSKCLGINKLTFFTNLLKYKARPAIREPSQSF